MEDGMVRRLNGVGEQRPAGGQEYAAFAMIKGCAVLDRVQMKEVRLKQNVMLLRACGTPNCEVAFHIGVTFQRDRLDHRRIAPTMGEMAPPIGRVTRKGDLMYRVSAILFSSLIAFCIGAAPVRAGEADITKDGAVTWQAGVDGVEIDWNLDGSIRRASSRYSTPVEFGDRRGIAKAQVIAEEKAKAAIIRFMKQAATSSRLVTEIENDLNKATQHRETGTAATVKKVDERTLIENLTELTGSFAAGTLSGVIVLEKGYDAKAEEAWVVVGVSDKTIRAARDLRSMTSGTHPAAAAPSPAKSDSIKIEPSEVHRSNQKNW